MKMSKRILGILLACVMLMCLMPIAASAAGTETDPIIVSKTHLGELSVYLFNTTLEAGDTDGVWYKFTAEDSDAGIMVIDSSAKQETVPEGEEAPPPMEFLITVWVDGVKYQSEEDGIFSRPIVPLPLKGGEEVIVHIIAKDTTESGYIYANAEFKTGASDTTTGTIPLKTANGKVHVAAGATVYFQDSSLQGEFIQKGLLVATSADVTITNGGKTFADTDKDGVIEAVLNGAEATAGSPAIKPVFAIANNSNEDLALVLTVADKAEVHECTGAYSCATTCGTCGNPVEPGEHTYDNMDDETCNDCDFVREIIPCDHEFSGNCDITCDICGRERDDAPHYKIPCGTRCQMCSATDLPMTGEHGAATSQGYCSNGCGTYVGCAEGIHQYQYPCDKVCQQCGEETNPDASCISNGFRPCQPGTCGYCGKPDAPAREGHRDSNNDGMCDYQCGTAVCHHKYDNDYDADCNLCGEFREVPICDHDYDSEKLDIFCTICKAAIPRTESEIIHWGGNSIAITEKVSGLAFKFDVAAADIVIGDEYVADYTNAYIIVDNVQYPLLGMGAVMNTELRDDCTIEDADNETVFNVPAKKAFVDQYENTCFSVRVIRIPDEHLDTPIVAIPYYTYQCEDEVKVVYGEPQIASYNEIAAP